MVGQRWFLSYDRRRGNAIGLESRGLARKAAAPATVTGEMPEATDPPTGLGRRGSKGKTLLRKPGDLPAQCLRPADGVFRDGETNLSNRWFVCLIASRQNFEEGDDRHASRLHHLSCRPIAARG
jgi:hypothetical protein